MKFFLVKDAGDAHAMHWSRPREGNINYYRSSIRKLDVIPTSGESSEVEKCALLKKFLELKTSSYPSTKHREGFWSCEVEVGVGVKEVAIQYENVRRGGLWIFNRISPKNDCLAQLGESFQGAKLLVDWHMMDKGEIVWTNSTREVHLSEPIIHFDLKGLCPVEQFENWKNSTKTINYKMTMAVTIPDDVFSQRCIPAPTAFRILNDEVLSDVTILCSDGTKIKAHRSFLAANSPVFLSMFQTEMKEARESVVKIPDMEAKSVRAFLKFLYYGDTQDPEEDAKVALELFQASHKYGVWLLEDKMRELILKKPNDWFDLETAVRLFMFARILTTADEELKMKMVKVLQLQSATLEKSPVMQELFPNEAALELVKYIAMHR